MTNQAIGKHRIEALSDGIYAIALTLLVLELKLPALPRGMNDSMLRAALVDLVPKVLTWMLSFWVMSQFWLAQQRVYHYLATLDLALVRFELMLLALVSLLPFSTALIGEQGDLVTAAALYGVHLLGIALLSWSRTAHVLKTPSLWAQDLSADVTRTMRLRSRVLSGCALATVLLAFVAPGYNMLAMLPMALLPTLARR